MASNNGNDRSINFAAVRAAVESGLRKLEHDPVRGVRGMLDLGKYFSTTHHQKNFFQTAQKMLGRRGSPYMQMIKQAVANVDHETLKTVGINLGYFSWSHGAEQIRANEAAYGFNIPWSFTILMGGQTADDAPDRLTPDELRATIAQARDLGSHCFWIGIGEHTPDAAEIISLCSTFKDCAFMLLMPPQLVHDPLIPAMLSAHNIVVFIKYSDDDDVDITLSALRDAHMLYGVYYEYTDTNCSRIIDGEICQRVAGWSGICALFIHSAGCSDICRKTVHAYATDERVSPEHPAFMVDYFDDIAIIDGNISKENCYIEIGPDGNIHSAPWGGPSGMNIRTATLADALAALVPRKAD